MLLSLEHAASGSNLTAANHVIFVHPMNADTLSSAVAYERQALARVRRVGQERAEVHVWRFVTRETVEEHMHQFLDFFFNVDYQFLFKHGVNVYCTHRLPARNHLGIEIVLVNVLPAWGQFCMFVILKLFIHSYSESFCLLLYIYIICRRQFASGFFLR